jgi:hypothetical protein
MVARSYPRPTPLKRPWASTAARTPDGAGGSACPPRYFDGLLAPNRQEGPHTWSIGNLEVPNWAGTRLLSRFAGSLGGRINHFSEIFWIPI